MTRQNPGSKLKKQDNKKPVKGQSKRKLEKERGPSNEDMGPTPGLNETLNNMPTQPAKFAEFIRQLAPLMPMYRSIELACVAARRGREWILISGEAVLSTEPCAPEAQISPVVKLEDIVALKECIPAERISDLVRDLRESYVVRNQNGIDVRLTAKGAPDYIWQLPKFVASRSRSNLWGRALALKGCDRDLSSLRSDYNLEKINLDLYASTSPYDGFDELCRDLGLPARLNNLTSLLKFQVSADLPARVTEIGFAEGTEAIYFNCLGTPDLDVLWSTDETAGERIPATSWDRAPSNMACRAPLRIPHGASGFSVVLSFGELIADYVTFDFYSEGDLPWGHVVLEGDEDICNDRKIQQLSKGEDELISREVVQKEPPMPDLATREAPTGIDKHRKDDGDIAEHRKIQELPKGKDELIPREVVQKEPPMPDLAIREAPNQGSGRRKRPIDPGSDVDKRRAIVKQCLDRGIRSSIGICQEFDRYKVLLPDGQMWEPFRERDDRWAAAFNTRPINEKRRQCIRVIIAHDKAWNRKNT
jgi:hypothetical protein